MTTQQRARAEVARAIREGRLPPANELRCADCASQGYGYDHRRYSEPLNVEPVCRGCNVRRGPAEDWTPEPRLKLDIPFESTAQLAALRRAAHEAGLLPATFARIVLLRELGLLPADERGGNRSAA